jgi:alpha-1,2-mannosyltransferase
MRLQAITERYLWIVGNLLVIGLFAIDLSQLHGLRIGDNVMWGRDFLNLWSGGRLAIEGRPGLLYDLGGYHDFLQRQFGPLALHLYSYPPTALLLDIPFGALPYPLAYALWTIGGAALFWWAARPHLRAAGLPGWWALATPAATINLWAGHFGFVMGALWLLAFHNFDDRPRRGGAITALMAVKPHMALLIPLLLLRRAKWSAIVVATGGVAAIVLLSWIVFGPALWGTYLHATSALELSTMAMTDQFFQTMMPTTTIALRQHPLTAPFAMIGQAITALVAIVLLWRAAGRDVPIARLCFPAATATFLVLPYAFDYDMTVAALGLMLTLHRRWKTMSVWERTALGAGFLAPQLCILLGMTGVPLTPLLLLAALVAQMRAEGLLHKTPFVLSDVEASAPPEPRTSTAFGANGV